MKTRYTTYNDYPFIEGPPGEALMAETNDINRVIEACLSERGKAALLYAPNMPPGFFDLSTGVAGEILQKLRNYKLRLALVCPPGSVEWSSRFGEMVADEQQGHEFGVFESRTAALPWLRPSTRLA
jgi:hypothetical protein